eukprot:4924838-Pyramimonas_sp.AAC.1
MHDDRTRARFQSETGHLSYIHVTRVQIYETSSPNPERASYGGGPAAHPEMKEALVLLSSCPRALTRDDAHSDANQPVPTCRAAQSSHTSDAACACARSRRAAACFLRAAANSASSLRAAPVCCTRAVP